MNSLKLLLFLLALGSVVACGDTMEVIPEPEVGMISGQVMHHEFPVREATVYIKFGATEFPGLNAEDYDRQLVISDDEAYYEFTGLAKGNYYLFSSGYDIICNCDVIGGIPVVLDTNSSIIETNIPVTE